MLQIALALLAMSPAPPAEGQDAARTKATTEAENAAPIVVFGESLADSARRLQDCIVNKCPPDKDIAATLRHAENQFVAGDYQSARRTLLQSRGRNQRFSKTFPVEVANLLRANSRIAAHLGEGEAYRIGALDALSALKAGLPDDHPRVLGARIEVADMLARFGRIEGAEQEYRAVARRGKELGLPTIEGYGLLRIAAMYATLAETDRGTYRLAAKRALEALINNNDPKLAIFVNAGRVIKARLDFKNGDPRAVDTLIASYQAQSPDKTPTLLYAPPIERFSSGRGGVDTSFGTNSALSKLAVQNFEGQWVDIGFWVSPEGKVTDAGILRASEKFNGRWTPPIIAAINGRRYAPIALEQGDPGVFRIERYTYTSRWTTNTGSRIRVREPEAQIEMLDLSPDAAKPGKGR
ncbi:hypothetical protein [Sphingomonas sp. 28-62-11]|uniref:hypothetical protein n=1 Tax=Sphingomonas sp. 28-62-11 TaxID=1970432 RepID=UPI000BCFEC66|nr:MAG: hypothetical protein B7Y49_02810 [Sphingomonas sp. 28-62-11]